MSFVSYRDGWVAISRAMREHPLVGFHLHAKPADQNKGAMQPALAFIDLIMECRYEDGAVMNGGHKMLVRRGELVGAISWLANRWNWTPKAVRGWLDRLEMDGMIARFRRSAEGVEIGMEKGNRSGNQAAIIRLCKYEIYQALQNYDWQSAGQSKGNQRAIKGQSKGNNNKDNKGTKEQEDNPPAPQGGEGGGEDFPGSQVERPKPSDVRRDCDSALEIFNKAATHFGFAQCESFTDGRRKRLAKRLADIGGVERFRVALRSLAHADPFTDFLLGKVKPRDGEQPFKLGFDRLLQTDGNLGDVLARLLDLSSSTAAKAREPPWAHWDEAEWVRQIAIHANGVWPFAKLSPAPATGKSACPPSVIEREKLIERYDENGFLRKHQPRGTTP